MMKSGRPKGLKVAVCPCGWRVTGKGKSVTCGECKRRVPLDQRVRGKKAA
jgi:hypothetical protein